MDPEKVETVKQWGLLESKHDVQKFLGFVNYYRKFIRGFALTAEPLTAVLSMDDKVIKREGLPELAHLAQRNLIDGITSYPILRIYGSSLPTRLVTDASGLAIAAYLSQLQPGRRQILAPSIFH